jgi:hypothetical protein
MDEFDDVSLAAPSSFVQSELALYLSQPVESVPNPLEWWVKKASMFPRLHRMALDYLTALGMSSFEYFGFYF